MVPNQQNKQASKIQPKHWNKEQTDSNQRDGETEIIEEEPSRNMYKGHMDKAKGYRFKGGRQGWVGQGAWCGENGHNCTSTTIKKKLH